MFSSDGGLIPAAGNAGQKRRLRELLGHARAELIAVSDQDDVWRPDKLALLLAALGGADLCFGSSWLIDAAGRELGRTLLDNFQPPVASDDRLIYLFRSTVSAHAMIVRRRLLDGASLIRARPFDWLLSLEAAFGGGIVYAPAAMTMHRMHDANQMNGANVHSRRRPRVVSRGLTLNHFANVTARRLTFVEFAEHLTYSEAVPRSIAETFADVRRTCTAAWFDSPRRPPDDVRARLVAALRPLAASERDWFHSERFVDSLTRAIFHPRHAMEHVRNALALPEPQPPAA